MDYSIIKPQRGYIVIKQAEEEKTALKRANQGEPNAYGTVIAVSEESKFEVGQFVVYNEFEGQELMKYGPVDEDGIVIMGEDKILAIIEIKKE